MSETYQKYFILSTYRSGTNLLTNLLNSHPQVVSHHEIFRSEYFRSASYGWKLLRYIFPVMFLQHFVFHAYPRLIKAVGFELQYDQAKSAHAKSVWQHLHNHKEIKIIHLKRKNQLATYLSYVVANKVRQWTTIKTNSIPRYRIELDPKSCMHYFMTIDRYRTLYDAYFARHDVLTIYYEDLAKEQQKTMRTIQRFLNLHQVKTKTLLKKQNTQQIERSIINYDELNKYFRRTKWHTFFLTPKSFKTSAQENKKTIVYIPYVEPGNDAQTNAISALAKSLSSCPNVLINIEMHTEWYRLTRCTNVTIIDTISKRARRNIIRECDYIMKFDSFSAPLDIQTEYMRHTYVYKKMVVSPKQLLTLIKKGTSVYG